MTKKIRLEVAIKRETAKMAWPGHMEPILKKGTKSDVEIFFAAKVNLACLLKKNIKQTGLDDWHSATVNCLADRLTKHINPRRESPPYSAQAVAAKLVNVFLHQLIKYKPFAHLYPYLHLPLDSQVWPEIKKAITSERRCQLKTILEKNPYTLSYDDEYIKIQKILWEVLDSLFTNDVLLQYGRSRILLNSTLWAGE